jgi:predicted N-formylglutamate amidohydrolase
MPHDVCQSPPRPDAGAAFEIANPAGRAPVLLLCDHATNIVPDAVAGGDLGLSAEEMRRHIAFDLGARGVTLELARLLDAPAILTRFSRLVIDPNRGEDDPTLVMRLYDGTIIPANRHITAEEKARRIAAWHRPYHQAIDRAIDRMLAAGQQPSLIAIHSFTPKLIGRTPRPWHVGILWHHDGRIALPLMKRLRREPGLCVGDNEPYTGQLEGDTMSQHGTGRGLAHVLIELRHDLIASPVAERVWAARLAPILLEALAAAQEESDNGQP